MSFFQGEGKDVPKRVQVCVCTEIQERNGFSEKDGRCTVSFEEGR